MSYVLSLDIATTSLKVAVITTTGVIVAITELHIDTIHPEHGYTEQKPDLIFDTLLDLIEKCLQQYNIKPKELKAIALTNAKGSIGALNTETGNVIDNFINNNDIRVNTILENLNKKKNKNLIHKKTALGLNHDLGALKMRWLLENNCEARRLLKEKKIVFITLDSFIIHRLTKGSLFVTDITNALSTGLVNIHTLDYDQELLDLFKIPSHCLPKIRSMSDDFGSTRIKIFPQPIKICSSLCNSQSSVFALGSLGKDTIKCNFSNTCSILLQLQKTTPPTSPYLTTVLSQKFRDKSPIFSVETTVNHAGSVVRWLQDAIGLIHTPRELESLAYSVPDSGGVFFVPTFSGVAAPLWDHNLQGTILGIKQSTNIGHIARASIEGIALQITQNIQAMLLAYPCKRASMHVGGKMAKNTFLMQMISDLTGLHVFTGKYSDSALIGTALLAHIHMRHIPSLKNLASLFKKENSYSPKYSKKKVQGILKNWNIALKATKSWSNKML